MISFVKQVYSFSNHMNSAFSGKRGGTPEAKYMTWETCVSCFVVNTVYRTICDPLSRMLLNLYLTMASASRTKNPITTSIDKTTQVLRSSSKWVFFEKTAAEDILLADPPTVRISTTCNQPVQTSIGEISYHNIAQHHYDLNLRIWRGFLSWWSAGPTYRRVQHQKSHAYRPTKVHLLYIAGCVTPLIGNLLEEKSCVNLLHFPTCVWIPEVCWKWNLITS